MTPRWISPRWREPVRDSDTGAGGHPCSRVPVGEVRGAATREPYLAISDVDRVIAGLLPDDQAWVNAQSIEMAGGYII